MLVSVIDGKLTFDLGTSGATGAQNVAVAFGQIDLVNLHASPRRPAQVGYNFHAPVASIPRVQGTNPAISVGMQTITEAQVGSAHRKLQLLLCIKFK